DVQDKVVSVSLGLALDGTGFQIIPHYDKDSERISTSYLIRVGEQFPSFDPDRYIEDKPQVVSVPMKGRLSYRKARWFDRDRMALLDMIELIENAKHDPEVDGIAFNLSGLESSRELLWEVREKLKEFKASGKQVYMYVDRAGMFTYYFASVADKVWIDPAGTLVLPGMVAGRTFWKGFLEKIGLGSEEFRYFTYKSAFEMLSRRDMSEPDREQRLAMIADLYDEWRGGIVEARGISADTLDAIVDSVIALNADDALAAGLVDTVASWSDVRELVEAWNGTKPELRSRRDVAAYSFADPAWGEPPKVAVVYAIGDCDLDTGIRGRYTSRTLNKLAKRKDVRAVILRADSPGGDALPSDLVAREMKALAEKKPMIVSQGSVAASGGYWISMYGSRIFTSPLTLTGSIGVIGGFVWNENFSEKTGFTYDRVQIGRHADLGEGVTLPLIGVAIPDRPFTDEERHGAERLIRGWYDDFTAKVADGRLLTQSYVDSIGQGRIWSGPRALELGLVDEIGGLDNAIVHARTASGLPAHGRRVEVIEFPPRSWVNPEDFGQSGGALGLAAAWLGLRAEPDMKIADDYELRYYRRISQNPGEPLFMVHPADLPAEE
ncbi:MAG: S49 family peptidase, partial [bacterium]|nr:S49 family peptidase [bacterium]